MKAWRKAARGINAWDGLKHCGRKSKTVYYMVPIMSELVKKLFKRAQIRDEVGSKV